MGHAAGLHGLWGPTQAEHAVSSWISVLGASFFLRHLSGPVFEERALKRNSVLKTSLFLLQRERSIPPWWKFFAAEQGEGSVPGEMQGVAGGRVLSTLSHFPELRPCRTGLRAWYGNLTSQGGTGICLQEIPLQANRTNSECTGRPFLPGWNIRPQALAPASLTYELQRAGCKV